MSEAEAQNATVAVPTANVGASASGLSVRVTVHMWITWAELAIEHAQAALAARRNMLDLNNKNQNFAGEMGRETAESLLAICSAAFAMDALVGAWARLVMDPQIVAKREAPGARINMSSQTEQVLRRACKDSKTALYLTARWRTVFGQRGGAVHFSEVSGPTVPHPSGITNAAQVHVDYSQETANSAVDLLLETLMAVESAAKPTMAKWINDMAGALTDLRNKRN